VTETNRAATLNAMADAANAAAVDADILARDTVEAAMQAQATMADADTQAGPSMADASTQAIGGMRRPTAPLTGQRRQREQ
jgi:hypothetical protein